MTVTGLANGSFSVAWWDCTAGTIVSSTTATAAGGSLTTTLPATTQTNLAFQLIPPTGVSSRIPTVSLTQTILTFRHGCISLSEPLSGSCRVTIMTIQGRTIAMRDISGSKVTSIPVGRLESGLYLVKISSGGRQIRQKLEVAD
jgi:hypothetical protein